MPKYEECPSAVARLARDVMAKFERHQLLIDAGVKIGFYFASPDLDEYGKPTNDAITVHGCPAYARAKNNSSLNRVKSHEDCEIVIDRDHWDKCSERQRMALLDHELYHFIPRLGQTDDLGRPKISMRKHDWQFGWFRLIAQSWGFDSVECDQARTIMANDGQFFWPVITGEPAAPLPPKVATAFVQACAEHDADVEELVTHLDAELLGKAIAVIQTEQKASVTLLQRRLSIGYNRAAILIEELERRGLIGAAAGSEPRTVNIEASFPEP